LNLKKFLWDYGEKVPGYNVTVINEREVRAATGILGMLGTVVIFIGIGFGHIIVARVYLAFLFLDFSARIISPKYSPSLLLGKMVVQNQKPEYVGGLQKRFAWTLGWLLAIPMMDWFVIHWDITFYKVLICVLCISLMFLETAFSVCIGCITYKTITGEDPEHCPGGTCEIRQKEPIQIFSLTQKIIVGLTLFALTVGVYLFLTKVPSKTFFGAFLHDAVLTKQQLKKEKDAAFQKEADKAFEDDDF